MEGDLLTQYEADHYIQALQEIPIEEYASPAWMRQHENLYKLNVQSHRNARNREDEYVIDLIVTWDKVKMLIYDLIVTDIWKQKVLPYLETELSELSTAKAYNLVYHEGVVANFLEVLIFHRTACEEAGDHLIDLIDWCYRKMVFLNAYKRSETRVDTSKLEDLKEQINDLNFNMGIASISMIRFITDHLSDLTLAVMQQLVDQCDIFCLLVPLMEQKPWIRELQSSKLVFHDNNWVPLKDDAKIPQAEAQIWLIVYNLFMNDDVRAKYELTSYRKNNLLRLRKFINSVVIDQIPVLGHLMRALEELSLVNENSSSRFSAFLIQQMPELGTSISEGKDWENIANRQRPWLTETEQERKAAMDLLLTGIDDMLGDPICAACGNLASNRCSKCKQEWYCSRKCQVGAWKKHKEICGLLAESAPRDKPKKEEEARPKITEITE